MEQIDTSSHVKVSVIIPCYNHGKYLPEAIQSVLSQDHPEIEIIVVDDGSSDNTKLVCEGFAGVKYVYQQNQGLYAARNTGIEASSGKFLVFLDADDWLLENAISINIEYLLADPSLAFVSGAYLKVVGIEKREEIKRVVVNDHHFENLLKGNYISMHATVMYRRWAFNDTRFDLDMKACEDYDVYLQVARKFKILHHQKLIAAYRIHDENMSGDILLMITTALRALEKQVPHLKSNDELSAYLQGKKNWVNFYSGILYVKLIKQLHLKEPNREDELKLLKQLNPLLFFKLVTKKYLHVG